MALTTWAVHGAMHAAGSIFHSFGHTFATASNMQSPSEYPPINELIELYVRGWITKNALKTFARSNGVALDLSNETTYRKFDPGFQALNKLWTARYYASIEIPPPGELFRLTNRGEIRRETLDIMLQRHGFGDDEMRGKLANLRYEVPGPADLVRFAVRHAFEPALVKKFTYEAERNEGPFLLDIFHQAAGINYPIFTGPLAPTVQLVTGKKPEELVRLYTAAGIKEPTWADIYWWSHWVLPSPSQGYEMLFRLRPDRNHFFDPPGTSAENFTLKDLGLLLRGNDYPPFYRDKLAAIAYRIPGIRFLRQLRSTDVFGKADVTELLLRQGYSPGDAEVLSESVERNDRDARRRGIETQAKGQLAKYWELGAISKQEYVNLLVKHGLTPEDAAAAAELADLDLTFKRLEKIINFVRGQYLKGVLTEIEALSQLIQAGVVEPRRSMYLQDWKMELQEKHKEISAQKAVQWACKGIITVEDLQRRLRNLGYREEDVSALKQEAALCTATLAARAVAGNQKAQEKSIAALKHSQREAAQAIVAARRQLASHGSPAQLRKWFCSGHLGQIELYTRLRSLGWPDEDITRLVSDCESSKGGGKGGQRGGSPGGG